EAGADRDAVQADRARTALPLLAGVLGAGQAHALAQDVQQALALPHVVGLLAPSVDGEGHAHRELPSLPWALPRYASQVQPRVRRAMTVSAWRRSAALPRTSSMGLAQAATSSANCRATAGGTIRPLSQRPPSSSAASRNSSAVVARIGVGAAEPMPVLT